MTSTKEDLWPQVLERLKLQVPKATFDAWLKQSTATKSSNGELVVTVTTEFAKDWLENRLHEIIQRTAESVANKQLHITYKVRETTTAPDQFSVELISYDPTTRGFVMTSLYAIRFWQPLLGFPFIIWTTLRAFAWQANKEGWPTIATLADICANSNRSRIIGRAASGSRRPTIGALEILERAKIISIRKTGSGSSIEYHFRVLDNLPLLSPSQVEQLTTRLQEAHTRWIQACEIDFDQWEQLKFNSLIEH